MPFSFFFFFFTAYLLLFFPYPTLVKGKIKEGEEVLFLGMRKTEDPNVHFEPILAFIPRTHNMKGTVRGFV